MSIDRRAELLARVLALSPEGTWLERLCDGSAQLLGVTGVLVASLSGSGGDGVVTASHPLARRLLELEFELGEGPCQDAHRDQEPVAISDLARPDGARTWTLYSPAALDAGARAVFAFPARLGGARLGVLALVRDRPGPLHNERWERAQILAEVATMLLLDDGARDGPDPVDARGWSSRAVVHQATGMVAVQLGIELGMALVRLRAHAFASDRPLDDVSRDVVERRLRFDP